jgi:hypothetical protein
MKKQLVLASVLLIAACGFGQTADPQSVPAGPVETENASTAPRYEENVRPLSGVQNYDLGYRADRFNLLTPSFAFSEAYGTNPGLSFGTNTEPVWASTTTVGGSLDMERGNARRLFTTSYQGSGQFSSYDSSLNTHLHKFDVTQSVQSGRWDFLIGDAVTYQPNAYGASAPLIYAGNQVPTDSGFSPGVTPNSTILTQQANQISNTAVGQLSYGLSRMSVLTANGSFGILRYLDGGFLDSKQFTAGGGFDHKFGRNTVGVSYNYARFMYDGLAPDFDTNTVQLTYARRVVGRFTFAIGAGPMITKITTGSVTDTQLDVSARASFEYAGNRSRMGIGYTRGVTGGSGLTPGAVTDSITGSGERQLTRSVSWNFAGGFSRNSATLTATEFNTVYVSTGIAHLVGRYVSISMGYRGQKQTSNSSIQDLSTNAVVASVVWHFRPVRLR